jgi:hypothetical protein
VALAALIVAIVAATVTLLNVGWTIFWSVWQHRKLTEPQVKVRASFGYMPDLPDVSPLVFTATNTGQVPITITGAKLTLPDADKHLALITWIVQTPKPLPIELTPGQNWVGIVNADEILAALPRIASGPMEGARGCHVRS